MPSKPRVTIGYGPSSWFAELLGEGKSTSLLKVVHGMDEANRRHTHVVEGQPEPEPPAPPRRLRRVVAASGDYASLNDHTITNFADLIRRINPKHLYLQNPPAAVRRQIEGVYEVETQRFDYPAVTADTLKQLNASFDKKIIGQERVRDSLLSALYRLTSPSRNKPVVLMFYGPSGVGKTETAHLVNSLLGGELMRRQLSMYQNEKFASYLFGGTHGEASFARDLLDRDSGVILIDEFDKANPLFHSAFYQFFDDGVFEDKNYHVEVGPSVIVCTSNYKSESEVQKALGDALYSRFDSLIEFGSLSEDSIVMIAHRIIDDRTALLTTDELAIVNIEDLKARFTTAANGLRNVRRLSKIVDELISRRLVSALLERA